MTTPWTRFNAGCGVAPGRWRKGALLAVLAAGLTFPALEAADLVDVLPGADDVIELYRQGSDLEASTRFYTWLQDPALSEQKDELRLYLGRTLETIGMTHSASTFLRQSARWPTLWGAEAAGSWILLEDQVGVDLREEGGVATFNPDTLVPRWAGGDWALLRGVRAAAAGGGDDALSLLERVKGPHRFEALTLMGRLSERQGDHGAASRHYKAAGGGARAWDADVEVWEAGVAERKALFASMDDRWAGKMERPDGVGLTVSFDPLPKPPPSPALTNAWVVPWPRVQAALGLARALLAQGRAPQAVDVLEGARVDEMLGREAALLLGQAAWGASAWTTATDALARASSGPPDISTLRALAQNRKLTPENKEKAVLARALAEQADLVIGQLSRFVEEHTASPVRAYEAARAQSVTATGPLPQTLVERLYVDVVVFNLARRIQTIEMEQLRWQVQPDAWQRSPLGQEVRDLLARDLAEWKLACGQRVVSLVKAELADAQRLKADPDSTAPFGAAGL